MFWNQEILPISFLPSHKSANSVQYKLSRATGATVTSYLFFPTLEIKISERIGSNEKFDWMITPKFFCKNKKWYQINDALLKISLCFFLKKKHFLFVPVTEMIQLRQENNLSFDVLIKRIGRLENTVFVDRYFRN